MEERRQDLGRVTMYELVVEILKRCLVNSDCFAGCSDRQLRLLRNKCVNELDKRLLGRGSV